MASMSAVTFESNRTVLHRMAQAGVPIEDARWFHLKAIKGGFSATADLMRGLEILLRVRNNGSKVVSA